MADITYKSPLSSLSQSIQTIAEALESLPEAQARICNQIEIALAQALYQEIERTQEVKQAIEKLAEKAARISEALDKQVSLTWQDTKASTPQAGQTELFKATEETPTHKDILASTTPGAFWRCTYCKSVQKSRKKETDPRDFRPDYCRSCGTDRVGGDSTSV